MLRPITVLITASVMSLTSQNDLLSFSLNMNGFAKLEHVMTSTIILTNSSVMHAGVGRTFFPKRGQQ